VRDLHDVRTSAMALTARVKNAHRRPRRKPKSIQNDEGVEER
jgi:hypothetical protein